MQKLIVSKLAFVLTVSALSFGVHGQSTDETAAEAFRAQYLQRFSSYQEAYADRWQAYYDKVAEVWGDQVLLSSNHTFVSYSDDLSERTVIDYENNTISLDVLVQPGQTSSTHDDIMRLLERFSQTTVAEAAQADPLLNESGVGNDRTILNTFAPGFTVDEVLQAAVLSTASFALLETTEPQKPSVERPTTSVEEEAAEKISQPAEPVNEEQPARTNEKRVERITLSLSDTDVYRRRAEPFVNDVHRFADQYGIPSDLIFAITQVESSFNPLAQSPIPAFGLMQVVPGSAGLDVNRMVFNRNAAPTQQELFQSERNLEYGTAYLNILYSHYLQGIDDPVSRFYCAIAAYNTGAGNVARAFNLNGQRNIATAVVEINKLTPDQVYQQLLAKLPYQETINYLPKVIGAQTHYQDL